MTAYLDLQRWWRNTKSGVATEEISERRIRGLERQYGIILPDDFRMYLQRSSPVGDAWDAANCTWWDFDRIKSASDEYPYPLPPEIGLRASTYLVFVDCMIRAWAWAISCADDDTRGNVAVIGVPGKLIVARTFSEFVVRYVSDFDSLF